MEKAFVNATLTLPEYGKGPLVGPLEEMRYNEYVELVKDANTRGWEPASVINLHPFSVTAQGVLLKEPRIPGVSLEDDFWKSSLKIQLKSGLEIPFNQYVIANPEFTVSEKPADEFDGAAMVKAKAWWPIDLAGDIVKQNNNLQPRGGVFCYKGVHSPLSNPATAAHEADIFEKSYAHAIAFYTSLFNEAERAYSSGNKELAKDITSYHRWTTRYLRKVGVLQEDPKWLTEVLSTGKGKPNICQNCGHQAHREAATCTECNFVINPFKAYQLGIIDLDTPGANAALRRCTKSQLEELKLYPEVLPLDEFRAKMAEDRGDSEEEKKGKKNKQ